eukprot:2466528-Rhodomonas_salina.3
MDPCIACFSLPARHHLSQDHTHCRTPSGPPASPLPGPSLIAASDSTVRFVELELALLGGGALQDLQQLPPHPRLRSSHAILPLHPRPLPYSRINVHRLTLEATLDLDCPLPPPSGSLLRLSSLVGICTLALSLRPPSRFWTVESDVQRLGTDCL